MVESVEKKWYVLHTYAGYENKVSSNLESRVQSMGMEDNIFRVVVPEEEAHEVKNGKDKVEMKKVFPGYVLVEMVMTTKLGTLCGTRPVLLVSWVHMVKGVSQRHCYLKKQNKSCIN